MLLPPQATPIIPIILLLPLLIPLVWLVIFWESMSYWSAFAFFVQLPVSPSIAHNLHLILHWPLDINCIFTLLLQSIWFLQTLLFHQIPKSQFNALFIIWKSKVCDQSIQCFLIEIAQSLVIINQQSLLFNPLLLLQIIIHLFQTTFLFRYLLLDIVLHEFLGLMSPLHRLGRLFKLGLRLLLSFGGQFIEKLIPFDAHT